MKAAYFNKTDAIKFLLRLGVDITQKDNVKKHNFIGYFILVW